MTTLVGWFEIPVVSMNRAIQYYEAVFGVTLAPTSRENPAVVSAYFPSATQGISGALVKNSGYNPSSAGSMVYFTVESVDAVIATVNKLGCRVLRPKTLVEGGGAFAWIEDYDGNRLGVRELPPG